MKWTFFANPLAIRFIRCVSPIPGLEINAGGAGWTMSQAKARCESEMIERAFELKDLRALGVRPVGIAAHLTYEQAKERAIQEAIETLCLYEVQRERRLNTFLTFRIFGITLGVARTSHGYFSMIRGALNGVPIAAYSAASSLISAVLKAWEEFQSIRFFRPSGEQLRRFTKAHMLFSPEELKHLQFKFEPRKLYFIDIINLLEESVERSNRVIVYYHAKKEVKVI